MDERVNQLRFTRRQFIRTAGVVGAGAGLTAACATLTTPTPAASSDEMSGMDMAAAPVAQAEPDYKAIDAAAQSQGRYFSGQHRQGSQFLGSGTALYDGR